MIASFNHNFIFIKTRKTGGTSAEIVLSTWCSGNDICTDITGEDELIRRSYGGRAMNFLDDPQELATFDRLVASGDIESIQSFRKSARRKYYNHMPASEVREVLPDFWDRAFKFTLERHPYETVVSKAWWAGRNKPQRDVRSLIDEVISSERFSNRSLYRSSQGKVIVDEVIPHETMWDRIAELGVTLGAPPIKDIPRAKGHFRKDRRPARDILSTDQKKRIVDLAAPEFELMGYEK